MKQWKIRITYSGVKQFTIAAPTEELAYDLAKEKIDLETFDPDTEGEFGDYDITELPSQKSSIAQFAAGLGTPDEGEEDEFA